MRRDGAGRTFLVAGSVCVVCSVLVSVSAVGLRGAREENRRLYERRHLLEVAGLVGPDAGPDEVEEAYRAVEARVLDFATGEFADVDPDAYDQARAARDPGRGVALPPDADPAGIGARARQGKLYLVRGAGGGTDMVVIPVRGRGLWSTLHGFLALEGDGATVRGIGFHQHGETPGLGGEVDNPAWRASWRGKRIYDGEGRPAVDVAKGRADPGAPGAVHRIDGLSGATVTSDGVEALVNYWVGDGLYGALLGRLAEEAE